MRISEAEVWCVWTEMAPGPHAGIVYVCRTKEDADRLAAAHPGDRVVGKRFDR